MATDLIVPLGESITEAVVAKWLKQVGEPVAVDEPLVDLETDKVSVSVQAPSAGVLTEQRAAPGATVKVGEVVGQIAAGVVAQANHEPNQKNGNAEARAVAQPVVVAPAAMVAASAASPSEDAQEPEYEAISVEGDAGASLAHLTPRMRKEIREHSSSPASARAVVVAPAPRPTVVAARPATPSVSHPLDEVVPMTPIRKTIAARLVEAQHTAAVLTTFNEVDMSQVIELRAQYQEAFTAKHGVKLGFMSFFAKACVDSLKEFPGLNAEMRGNDIVYKKRYDLGIAVGGGKGLVVPVVRNVDRLGFAEIEKAIAVLGQRAKENKLSLDDLSGGTFTITNGGIYGSMMSTPLLNLPQTGILGMHNIVKRPIAVGAEVVIRPMMYLAVSYDHRVVDGREAVSFLVALKQRLEAPARMLFSI